MDAIRSAIQSARNIFDYSSAAFTKLSDQIWLSGQNALRAELALLDHQADEDEAARLQLQNNRADPSPRSAPATIQDDTLMDVSM